LPRAELFQIPASRTTSPSGGGENSADAPEICLAHVVDLEREARDLDRVAEEADAWT